MITKFFCEYCAKTLAKTVRSLLLELSIWRTLVNDDKTANNKHSKTMTTVKTVEVFLSVVLFTVTIT